MWMQWIPPLEMGCTWSTCIPRLRARVYRAKKSAPSSTRTSEPSSWLGVWHCKPGSIWPNIFAKWACSWHAIPSFAARSIQGSPCDTAWRTRSPTPADPVSSGSSRIAHTTCRPSIGRPCSAYLCRRTPGACAQNTWCVFYSGSTEFSVSVGSKCWRTTSPSSAANVCARASAKSGDGKPRFFKSIFRSKRIRSLSS